MSHTFQLDITGRYTYSFLPQFVFFCFDLRPIHPQTFVHPYRLLTHHFLQFPCPKHLLYLTIFPPSTKHALPAPTPNSPSKRLRTQLEQLHIPFTTDFPRALSTSDAIIDAIFGFSFSGEVRDPFGPVISALAASNLPILAVDAPSSWNIETGPPSDGPGKGYMPQALISLTAPKPLVKWFQGRHFVGGRFLGPDVAEKYGIDVPEYEGVSQILEVGVEAQGEGKL